MIMSDNTYITILSFMVSKLKLSGNHLIVYAVIYGFSQDGEGWFYGSLEYLSRMTGITRRTVVNVLNKLHEDGLIEKDILDSGRVRYKVRKTFLPSEKIALPSEDFSLVSGEKIALPSEKIAPYIEIDNKQTNNKKIFIRPSIAEITAYCEERGNNIDANQFHDYYESNGWKVGRNSMKDWKSAVRYWERNDQSKNKKPVRKEQRSDYYTNDVPW